MAKHLNTSYSIRLYSKVIEQEGEKEKWSKAEGSEDAYHTPKLLGFLPNLQLLQHKTFKLNTIK
jgi:hypothetical protein